MIVVGGGSGKSETKIVSSPFQEKKIASAKGLKK